MMTCFGHQNGTIVSLICCIKLQEIFLRLSKYIFTICDLSLLFVVIVMPVVTVATELLLFLLFVMIMFVFVI